MSMARTRGRCRKRYRDPGTTVRELCACFTLCPGLAAGRKAYQM
jgi:hypothetical protein